MKNSIKNSDFSKIFTFFKGRVALYAILKAIGIKKGDEVILPGFTCIVVPNAIVYLGGKPVYVDIDPETYNIDASLIEEKITPRTKAIIAQHTFGIPAEMDKIISIAKKHDLFVIEDSCHALGSKYLGKETGSWGDAAFFSSQWSKPITTGLGGWAVINNPDLRKKLEKIYADFKAPRWYEALILRFQFIVYKYFMTPSLFWFARNIYRKLSGMGMAIGSSTNEELKTEMPADYQKRMSSWQVGILKRSLRNVDQLIKHRRWAASQYERILSDAGEKIVNLPEKYDPVFLGYPFMVDDKKGILERARKNRVEMGDWFISPVHPNEDGWDKVYYTKGMCPVAEDICKHVVNLPTNKKIDKRQINAVSRLIKTTK